ncbi:MAG: DUF5343 domain-containing protein [Candidatus Heimdallarchaeota archaeon]|nr:DUF5343 domain-containing protein [Candidatus Heimdallarchaeota archaeon]
MALPDSYTIKTGAIPVYFEAFLGAEAPERFSTKFLENLEFTSSNDRLIIGVLKELGFLNTDGVPQDRYHEFLDKSRSWTILAEGIKEAYVDLFAVNKEADTLDIEGAFNKLKTLYKGTKKDTVIRNIAKTFVALCEVADFSKSTGKKAKPKIQDATDDGKSDPKDDKLPEGNVSFGALQYHINIVLPDTRDQAVFDSIFKSLRDHLG